MRPIIGIVARSHKDINGDAALVCYESLNRSIIKAGGIAFTILPNQDIEYNVSIPNKIERLTNLYMNTQKVKIYQYLVYVLECS